MEFQVSNKMKDMQASAIREFFKYSSMPGVISMSAGSPSPEALPVDDIRRLMSEIMQSDVEQALVYSVSEGHPPLRKKLKEHLRVQYKSFDEERDDLLITSGAQQCMDLTCKVLCNEGDVVLCEDPSFTGSVNCFRSYGVTPVGVPVQPDGIDVELLEKALKEEKNVRFLYLIPNFQNPTGITMSLEKRRRCYELAKQYGVAILEDDPYGDLRFAGEALPSIKSMDTEGIVFYARTFSKILSAGIRVGYIAAPKAVFGKLVVAKQATDVHTGMLSQLLCYRFMAEVDLDAHIQRIRQVYKRKCGLMLEELAKLPTEKISYTKPHGGLFVWADLHCMEDAGAFCMDLVQNSKVSVVPGTGFFAKQGQKIPAFRMTFAAPSDEQIVRGIGAIGELLGKY